MRVSLLVAFVCGLSWGPLASAAAAEFKGYFDVGPVVVPDLKEPDWGCRQDGNRFLCLCIRADRCPPVTAVEIKGVLRSEDLPAAFADGGPLSPAVLLA